MLLDSTVNNQQLLKPSEQHRFVWTTPNTSKVHQKLTRFRGKCRQRRHFHRATSQKIGLIETGGTYYCIHSVKLVKVFVLKLYCRSAPDASSSTTRCHISLVRVSQSQMLSFDTHTHIMQTMIGQYDIP